MLIELGYIARMARVGTVQVLNQPYIRTAVLKGLPKRRVIFGHVLRNALVPTVTVIGSQVGWLIGGLVVVEFLFDYPGIGNYTVNAALNHDLPLLEACVLIIAVHLHGRPTSSPTSWSRCSTRASARRADVAATGTTTRSQGRGTPGRRGRGGRTAPPAALHRQIAAAQPDLHGRSGHRALLGLHGALLDAHHAGSDGA